ncbi:MAG: autotransporter outer membrane beta-barrel domain-containing protein, partial [Prosthecobacter sp.]
SSANTWQISGGSLQAVASGDAIEINNTSGGAVTFAAPILANGSNTVTLRGTGTTVFTAANSYTGGTTLRGGTLEVTTGGAISHPGSTLWVAINPGETATLVLSGGSISNVHGYLGYSLGSLGTVNVSGGTWTNSGILLIGHQGTGVLNLSGTGSVSNTLGYLGNSAGSVGTANVSGGTWTNSNDLYLGNSGTGVLNLSGTGSVSNTRAVLGQVSGGVGTANVSGGTWTNSGNLLIGESGTGVLDLTGGEVYAGGIAGMGTVTLGANAGSSGTLNFGTGGSVGILNAATITGGSGTAVVNFNHTGSLSVAPVLTGTLSVNKLGAGTTTLTQASTYAGGTSIMAGELKVSNTTGSATGTGTLTLGTGATLSGSGIIAAGASAITLNGSLSIGDNNNAAADLALGTTTGGGITLGSTGSMTFDLFSGAGAGNNTGNITASDLLILYGDISLLNGASLILNNPNNMSAWAWGDQWKLWNVTGAGTITGSFNIASILGPALSGINVWSFDSSTGILSIVPEPGRASLIFLGLCGLLLRRRRA